MEQEATKPKVTSMLVKVKLQRYRVRGQPNVQVFSRITQKPSTRDESIQIIEHACA